MCITATGASDRPGPRWSAGWASPAIRPPLSVSVRARFFSSVPEAPHSHARTLCTVV